MRRKRRRVTTLAATAVVVTMAMAACVPLPVQVVTPDIPPSTATPTEQPPTTGQETGGEPVLVESMAPIESVEVLGAEYLPLEITLSVTSGLPNSCARFDRREVGRDDDTIRVTIINVEPAGAICADVYGTVTHHIPLEFEFEPGRTYSVEVNDVIELFETGTDSEPPPAAAATLNRPFRLELGQAAALGPDGPFVEFLEVVEDSRCPKDVVCVWEGRARILIRVYSVDDVLGFGVQNLNLEVGRVHARENSVAGTRAIYLVQLLALDPYPVSGGEGPEVQHPAYTATLLVSRMEARPRLPTATPTTLPQRPPTATPTSIPPRPPTATPTSTPYRSPTRTSTPTSTPYRPPTRTSTPTRTPYRPPTSTSTPTSTPYRPPTSTSTPTSPPICRVRTDWHAYTVGRGDTLFNIAGRAGITVDTLMRANCLTGTSILVGQVLYVPGPIPPLRTPSPQRIWFFLIIPGDNGQSGPAVGCGDSAVAVASDRSATGSTEADIRASLEELFSIHTPNYGQSGYTHSLFAANLIVQSVDLDGRAAEIRLSGTLPLVGTCADAQMEAQIRMTVFQYGGFDTALITLNGISLKQVFDVSGTVGPDDPYWR